jgi:hypothetical protein
VRNGVKEPTECVKEAVPSGGYRSAIPKWQRMEEDLLAKGINPFSIDWSKRSKK